MSKKEEHEEHVNHERWLVSYADMVTLLMVVFIILFAMATVDAKKFAALAAGLNGESTAPTQSVIEGSTSVMDEGGSIKILDTEFDSTSVEFELPTTPQSYNVKLAKEALDAQQADAAKAAEEKNNLEQVKQEIQASLEARGMSDQVKYTFNGRGLVVTVVTDKVLFGSGSASLSGSAPSILDAIGEPLSRIPNEIAVEGHTDTSPISTSQFPSNWELSTARSTSVARYLVDHTGVTPTRVGAMGYGEFRPVVPNDTAAHKAQNRRVEVIVLTSTKD
jgi:chemotaxis protein MotB